MNLKLVSTYSKSLFQNVKAKKKKGDPNSLEEKNLSADINIVGEELSLIRSILLSSPEVQSIFQNPTYSEAIKLNVLLEIFPGLNFTMKSFLKILAERNHLCLLPEISEEYAKMLASYKKSLQVKIITASPLEESIGNNLLVNLKRLTKANEILLSVAYNPKLLGGLIIEYSSIAIDLSILKEFGFFFTER